MVQNVEIVKSFDVRLAFLNPHSFYLRAAIGAIPQVENPGRIPTFLAMAGTQITVKRMWGLLPEKTVRGESGIMRNSQHGPNAVVTASMCIR